MIIEHLLAPTESHTTCLKLLAGKMVETVLKPQSPQHLVNRQLKTKQNKLFIVFHSAEKLKSRAKYKAYELQNYHFF